MYIPEAVYTGHNSPCDQELLVFLLRAFTDVPGTGLSMCVLAFYCVGILLMGPVPLGYIINSNIREMYVGGVTAKIVINCDI